MSRRGIRVVKVKPDSGSNPASEEGDDKGCLLVIAFVLNGLLTFFCFFHFFRSFKAFSNFSHQVVRQLGDLLAVLGFRFHQCSILFLNNNSPYRQ